MRIEDARAAVIAGVQNYRPSAEFPVPNSLIDFMLFQEAAFAIRQSNIVIPADWMFTRFSCITAEAGSNSCGAFWKVDLPFVPAEMFDAIGMVSIADPVQKIGKTLSLRSVSYNSLGISGGMVDPPSVDKPAYTVSGTTMYLLGRKDFSSCKVFISAVVGSLQEGYECDTEASLPVPMGGGAPVIESVTQKVIRSLYGSPEDKVEDNEPNQ